MTEPTPPAVPEPTPTPAPAATPAATPYTAPAATPYTASAAPAGAGRPTNVLAIIALIAAFVFPIAGIIVGHIALSQIKKTGEAGHGLALWGTILGYVFTVGYILLFLLAFLLPLLFLGAAGYTTY